MVIGGCDALTVWSQNSCSCVDTPIGHKLIDNQNIVRSCDALGQAPCKTHPGEGEGGRCLTQGQREHHVPSHDYAVKT